MYQLMNTCFTYRDVRRRNIIQRYRYDRSRVVVAIRGKHSNIAGDPCCSHCLFITGKEEEEMWMPSQKCAPFWQGNKFSHGPRCGGVLNQNLSNAPASVSPSLTPSTASNYIHRGWWKRNQELRPPATCDVFHSSIHSTLPHSTPSVSLGINYYGYASSQRKRTVNYCFDTCFWLNLNNDWIMWPHFLRVTWHSLDVGRKLKVA